MLFFPNDSLSFFLLIFHKTLLIFFFHVKSAMASSTPRATPRSGRQRDKAWKYGIAGSKKGEVTCTECTRWMTGGINRLKYHLAQIPGYGVEACPKSTPEIIREMKAILAENDMHKEERQKTREAIAAAMNPTLSTSGPIGHSRGRQSLSSFGDNEGEASGTPVRSDPNFFVPRNVPGAQPSLEGTGWNREKHEQARIAASNFWFYNNLSFNAANNVYWESFVNACTVAGKGFKAPTGHDFSGPLLEKAVKNTEGVVDDQKRYWKRKGCSILSDGWIDGRNRTLLNFLVASNGAMVFIKSVDASNEIKNAETLCNLLDGVVREVGVENVVQIITDNAAAYVSVGRMLMQRHPSITWSPCAAHCLDLVLEDIGKIGWVKKVVEDAKSVTKFIYNHTWVLALMRKHTNGKDLVRPGVTRFASHFITLQSILSAIPHLKQMFVSDAWLGSAYSKRPEAEKIVTIVFDEGFNKSGEELTAVTEPLVRVLRMVDGEGMPMGFIYEAMDRAKEAISHYYRGNARKCEIFWRFIDRRWTNQLHQPIHAFAYFLNPKFYFSDSFRADEEVMAGVITCIDKMTPDPELRDKVLDELEIYKSAEGRLFSSQLAIDRRGKQQPDLWWENYGAGTPNLQKIAIRVLSQPCSASGCERNWSVFESIHTKKRNRLSQKRLNDLVFVRYNLRLRVRQVEGVSHEAIDLDEIDPYGDWTMNEQNDGDDVLLTEEEIAEIERGAAQDAEGARLDEDEDEDEDDDEDYDFEEESSHHLDTTTPTATTSSSRPEKLSYIRKNTKRKM
ncbi:uncharacterized protein LOC131873640 isoform X1 [Cryptomeria japonica]|uniref:uncharacterized protein LOC131873640 isoform X1 n=2 Tax=Cryptomeria japonica TaxID=3369 RepID=UPI0027DA9AA3|nr:uncharacterized protein LOC131873640 isoform X1 [Cryptomeria japonica]